MKTNIARKLFTTTVFAAALGLGAGTALAAHGVPSDEDSPHVAELGRLAQPAPVFPDLGEESRDVYEIGAEPQDAVVRLDDAEEPTELTELGPDSRG